MPFVRIDVKHPWPPAGRKALIDAVHAAMVEAIKIPPADRQLVLQEHRPEDFETPSGKTDKYTVITITLFPGRSPEAKKALYEAVTRRLGPLGIPPGDVLVILHEVPQGHWGFGPVSGSEMTWGFKIDV